MKVSSLQSCLLSLDGTLSTFGEQVTNNQTSGSATEDSLTRSEAELRTTIERHPNAPTAQELCLFVFCCLFVCLMSPQSAQGREVAPRLTHSQLRWILHWQLFCSLVAFIVCWFFFFGGLHHTIDPLLLGSMYIWSLLNQLNRS